MACIDRTKGMGYLQATAWLERMTKRYTQHQCPKCNLWHIWKRKKK